MAELVLQQGGADLVATIISPGGERLLVDAREAGPEPFLVDAPVAGIYRLEVSTSNKRQAATPFLLVVGEFRPRNEDDALRLEAQQLSTAAKRHGPKPEEIHEAVGSCSRALELWRKLGDRQGEAATQLLLGSDFLQLHEDEEAKSHFLKALDLAQSEGTHWIEGATLSNLGLVLWQGGDFSGAIERFERARAIWKELGYQYGVAAILNNLGLKYRATGDYDRALKNYKQALALLPVLGDRSHEAVLRNNIGVVQRALAENAEALESFKRAAALYHATNDSGGEGRAMLHVARIHVAAHRRRLARRYLDRALPLVQAAQDYRSVGDGFELLGDLLVASGPPQEALRNYENALTAYRKVSNRAGEAGALDSIGVFSGQRGALADAIDYLNRAQVIRHELGVRDDEAETLFQLARVEREAGKLQEARTHIDAALDLAESVRALVAGPQQRMSYLASKNEYYSFACDLYRQLDRENPGEDFARQGIAIAERGRARGLLDLMAETQIGIGESGSRGLVDRERRLHEALNVLSRDVADASTRNDRPKLEASTRKLDRAMQEYYQLESDIRDADPRYARLAPRPLNADEIQRLLLDSQTVLLEYSLGDQHSSLWLLTPQSVTLFTLPGRAAVENAVRRFFEALKHAGRESSFPEKQGKGSDAGKAAAALSRMILPPSSAGLRGKRMLIVGDGVLQRVPFAALPGPDSAAPLIEDHEMVFLPSASVAASELSETAPRKAASGILAVVADPVFDAGDARTEKPVPGVKPVFARLPYSRREADEILKLAPAHTSLRAVDFDADRPLFTSGRLSSYSMVHIATHAVVDAARPELSALVFSLVDHKGNPRNGYLRLHEITSLHLPAKLVTLSACGTGLGKEVRGEGTVGLARGFIHGGAATVVVSLWDVEDESTAELMRLFYEGMLGRRHLRPAAALREAQRAMRKSGNWTPYQWSGWLAIGEWL